jgi:Tol biopolymer transport system component
MDRTGANKRRLTSFTGFDGDPTWSPNGGSIVFSTSRWGGEELALLTLAAVDIQRCEA